MASTLLSAWHGQAPPEAAAAAGCRTRQRGCGDGVDGDDSDDSSGCSSAVGALKEEGGRVKGRGLGAAVTVELAVDAFRVDKACRRVLLTLARAAAQARGRRRIADSR